MCDAIWRTSQSGHSVGRVQSSGVSARSARIVRAYSVAASFIASLRVSAGIVETVTVCVSITTSASCGPAAYARNMSIVSSRSRRQRSPPGSLAHCCCIRPLRSAVQMSRSSGWVIPMSASRSRASSRTRTAGAYASGDGSKPGIVRRNSSWRPGRSSSAKTRRSGARPTGNARRVPGRVADCFHAPEQLLVALLEHGVVDRVLGVEVRVDRLRPHPDPIAEKSRSESSVRPCSPPAPTPLRGSPPGSRRGVPLGGPAVAARDLRLPVGDRFT